MFRLHDRTRRRICVAAFFLFCVLPAVLILLWGITRHWPGYVAAEARRLSRQLGLCVSLEGLKYLRPGAVLYQGLQLSNPETGQTLLRCRVLEADYSHATDAEGRRKPSLVLMASQPEIQAEGLPRLWRLVRQPLQCEGGAAEFDVRLAAADLTVKSAQGAATLTGVQGSIEMLSGGSQAQVAFRLAGADMPQPARVRIVRNRQITPPASGFEIDTGGGSLPCTLLAMGLPELNSLGPDARFRGYIWANETAGQPAGAWDGEVTGQMSRVDLGQLVSERFPHRLSGTAQLSIQSARFYRGRLEEGTCTLTAGPGVISRSLVDAAAAKLTLQRGARPATQGDMLPYQELSLAALLDSNGLRLQGRCATGDPGTILSDGRQRLLGEPLLQPQPVVALLQTLVPASEVQVPATRQTDWLVRHLPVPRVVPPQGTENVAPYPRLRLGRAVEK